VQQLGRVGDQLEEAVSGHGFITLLGGHASYNSLFEVDPAPGVRKKLHVKYQHVDTARSSKDSPSSAPRTLGTEETAEEEGEGEEGGNRGGSSSSLHASTVVHEVDSVEDDELLISTVPDDTRWADQAYQIRGREADYFEVMSTRADSVHRELRCTQVGTNSVGTNKCGHEQCGHEQCGHKHK
jgi:hypothetical protein